MEWGRLQVLQRSACRAQIVGIQSRRWLAPFHWLLVLACFPTPLSLSIMEFPHATHLNRREALKRLMLAAGACSFPAIIPARVRGTNAPSQRINLLMLGMGRQAFQTNLPTLINIPGVQVVAVCDVDRDRAQAGKGAVDAHYGNTDCRAFQDYREAIEMPGLDAVMNSTPDHWHVITSLAAIRKGLHVSCEKPLTRYIAEGRLLAAAAQAAGVVFRTDSECRSHSYMIRTAELALNGYLGTITRFEIGVPREKIGYGDPTPMPVPDSLNYDMWLGPADLRPYSRDRVHPPSDWSRPGWMRVLDYAEGMITNWGTHLIDVANLINGSERTGPISVEGIGTYPPEGSLWNTLIDFQARYLFANGVIMDHKIDVPYLRVEGDEGWIQAHWHSEGGLQAHDPSILRTALRPNDRRVARRSDKGDFINAIKTGAPVMADAEVGHRTCSVAQLGHIAIRRGKRLEWDPQAERFLNDEEANRLLGGSYREPFLLR